jgi:hypothetical protein
VITRADGGMGKVLAAEFQSRGYQHALRDASY